MKMQRVMVVIMDLRSVKIRTVIMSSTAAALELPEVRAEVDQVMVAMMMMTMRKIMVATARAETPMKSAPTIFR